MRRLSLNSPVSASYGSCETYLNRVGDVAFALVSNKGVSVKREFVEALADPSGLWCRLQRISLPRCERVCGVGLLRPALRQSPSRLHVLLPRIMLLAPRKSLFHGRRVLSLYLFYGRR